MSKKLILIFIFVMVLSPLAAAHAQDSDILVMAYGETHNGTLASVEQGNIYSFVGSAGDQIVIDATSAKVDTYLRLGDSEGAILTENDNADTSTKDARIEYTLTAKGTYYFAVVGYSTGAYTVSLNLATTQSSGQDEALVAIAYGETAKGSLANADDGVVYMFSGKAGDQITLQASSTDTDVYLWLGDGEANELATNDDIAADNLNAQIDFVLPADGDYLVVVMAYDAGTYTLTLSSAKQSASNQNTGSTNNFPMIAYGDTVEGTTIDLENPVIYGFTGAAGDVVTIQASSTVVDTYLIVVDAETNLVGENDDVSKSDTNAALEVTLPADGTYYIGVLGYSSGPFSMTISTGKGGGVTSNVSQLMGGKFAAPPAEGN